FFRWILTPYENLPSEVAVVTWRWRYEAPCVQVDEINDFLDRHYRQAPEDIASEGAFDDGFIGR
ncbi:MAG: DUF3105 domain-containing protein, partial [Myxococcales bacterium]|nr:DUF3105 domain-containing protein [Myxococcales bacterium]